MKIIEGRYYRTRDGRKVGPIERNSYGGYFWRAPNGQLGDYGSFWCEDGKYHQGAERPHDLIAEWTEEPVTWGDMSDEEKGALLLAKHEGKEIQYKERGVDVWRKAVQICDNWAFRVKPEPEVKEVVLFAGCYGGLGKDMVGPTLRQLFPKLEIKE